MFKNTLEQYAHFFKKKEQIKGLFFKELKLSFCAKQNSPDDNWKCSRLLKFAGFQSFSSFFYSLFSFQLTPVVFSRWFFYVFQHPVWVLNFFKKVTTFFVLLHKKILVRGKSNLVGCKRCYILGAAFGENPSKRL